MKPISTLLALSIQLLANGIVYCSEIATVPRPNFVVILCDDLGWGDLGCFGHPHIQTPNLNKLAAEGIRFTNAYSAASVCSPSRVGLLTGRNPNRAGIFDWIPEANTKSTADSTSRHLVHLRKEEITLPQLLRNAGYSTAVTGKWHCNAAFNSTDQPQPNDAGFDHWFATQNNAGPSHENPTNFVRNGVRVGRQEGFSCRIVAKEATEWLENQQKTESTKPFFLYMTFHEPHEPIVSPKALVAKYLQVARNEDEAQYFANVENMDQAVGDLLATLDRLKVADDTLIYFSSDNGPETLNRYPAAKRSYGRPGELRGMKLWTTEGGFRVPGIMRWPKKIQRGQLFDLPVSSLDLLPTFCVLSNTQPPQGRKLDGTDISSIFDGKPLNRSQPLFWAYFNALNEQRVAMRDGEWKLLAKLDGGHAPLLSNLTDESAVALRAAKLTDFSLYRLTTDPNESHDLAVAEPRQLADSVAKMNQLYRELANDMHVWPATLSQNAKSKTKE